MSDTPVYVRVPTQHDHPYLKNHSAAEAVISVVMATQMRGWFRLHGFVVLPHALELIFTPIKQSVASIVATIQSETIPQLNVLLPESGHVWAQRHQIVNLTQQNLLDMQLQMILQAPVAHNLTTDPTKYLYSSANPRYQAGIVAYSGYSRAATPTQPPALHRLQDYSDDEATAVMPGSVLRKLLSEYNANNNADEDTKKFDAQT
jgi:hypothetical protein